jgi:hypothetical protein
LAGVISLCFQEGRLLGMVILTFLSISVFFYNLVWQFSRIDSVTGGTPRVSKLYPLAFAVLLCGHIAVMESFLRDEPILSLLGGFLIVGGILIAQASNALLLNHIAKGRRWKLA